MKHSAPIYPGQYEIRELDGIKYLYCSDSKEKIFKKYEFSGNSDSKELMKDLIAFTATTDEKILIGCAEDDEKKRQDVLQPTKKNSYFF